MFIFQFCCHRMRGYGDTGGRTSSRRITPSGDSNILPLYFCLHSGLYFAKLQEIFSNTWGTTKNENYTHRGSQLLSISVYICGFFFCKIATNIYIISKGESCLCIYAVAVFVFLKIEEKNENMSITPGGISASSVAFLFVFEFP